MTVDNRVSLSTECEYRLNSDTLFEVVTVIEQLTMHWRYEIHSLTDKPALCCIPIEKQSHGDCYPITQSNMNFWASCIVSYSIGSSVDSDITEYFRSGILLHFQSPKN
jgi:hypothetical protein